MQLSKRKLNSHKGSFGRVLIIAGSYAMTGAAVLASKACLRAGAGIVTLAAPKGLHEIFASQLVEVMTLGLAQTSELTISRKAFGQVRSFLNKADVCVIGPGISLHPSTRKFVEDFFKTRNIRTVADADALNALSRNPALIRKANNQELVVTPHLGEMARLCGLKVADIQKKRKFLAQKFASEYNVTVLLKGFRTVVASSGEMYLNNTGNPGMATAGSGDVLSGIVGAFLAQGLDGFKASKYAAYIHGFAGDLAAKEKGELGLIASDIIEKIPEAIRKSS